MREIKLCIVGEMSVGKTSILSRFTENKFDRTHRATLGATFISKCVITHDGETVKYNIWDTAGQERFKTMNRLYYRGATVIMIVYDITDARTFHNVKFWHKEAENHRESANVVLVLVGNKSDLEEQREVTRESGESSAAHIGAHFFEVSAKTSDNVENLFQEICKHLPAIEESPVTPKYGLPESKLPLNVDLPKCC